MGIIWIRGGSFVSYIGPVQDFIDRQIAADVAAGNTMGLEVEVRNAYDVFIRDSINAGDLGTSGGVLSQANSIMKATVPMCGARTLQGCLVPLVGPSPTRFGTAAGWNYNRKTGLAGNGTDNYLNSNRLTTSDPQDNCSLGVYVTTAATLSGRALIGYAGGSGETAIFDTIAPFRLRGTATTGLAIFGVAGFLGASRSAATSYSYRLNQNTASVNNTSATPPAVNMSVFSRTSASGVLGSNPANARISFYHIGEALSLTLVDARVTTLMNAIAAAIP
jgi:hypothetical protein